MPVLPPRPEMDLGKAEIARRSVLTGEVLTIAEGRALDIGGFEIHIDVGAERRLAGRSRGMQVGQFVYLDPRSFVPGTYEGRYLLAHELAHAAQRHLPADAAGEDQAVLAEIEAASIGHTCARGQGLVQSRVPLPGGELVARRLDGLCETCAAAQGAAKQ